MNAGVSGSDPFFDYKALKDNLIEYRPDFVIQALSSNDIDSDISVRGGMERFEKEKLKFKKAPWWEAVYASSRLSRLFFSYAGYNEFLLKKFNEAEIQEFNELIKNLFEEYASFCRENNINLYVVLRPDEHEIINIKYSYDFSDIKYFLENNSNIVFIDLLPAYKEFIDSKGMEPSDFFWKLDGHHNSKGYEMMAKSIYSGLKENIEGLK